MRRVAGLGRIALSLLIVTLLLGLLVLIAPGKPRPVDGVALLSRVTVCADPRPGVPCEATPAQLPVHGAIGQTLRLQADLPRADRGTAPGPMALHFPQLSDGLDVYLNGMPVLHTAPDGGPYWHWNRPAYLRLPATLLTGRDRLELVVHSAPLFAPSLAPFQFGPDLVLHDVFRLRQMATRDVAWLGLLLTVLCTAGLAALAVVRRRDRVYHWAALAGASATVLSLHYAAWRPPLPEALWQAVWTVSVPLLVAALHRFIRRFLRRPRDRAETATLWFALLSVPVMLLLPDRHLLIGAAAIHTVVLGITLYLLALFVRDRRHTTRGRFLTLYLSMALTAALALHDAVFLYVRPPPVTMQLGQFMPLVFMFVTGWLVLMQLVTALARQEALAGRLRLRVIERSRALRRTADRLEQSERETLVAQERQRIMMDLHDGVGGHLVNALAALRQAPDADPLLRDVLEEAQTDLGLMVDSLDNPGDVVALLAALRARLEPVLERQGLRFDWRVEDEPRLPDPSPTANINLLRIVQEFVTNTIKHAGADRITVQTGATRLRLADNGRGFDPGAVPLRGQGVASMRRRAALIGIRVDLRSGPDGTEMRLDWSDG